MTAHEYAEMIRAQATKDQWVGDWLVRRLFANTRKKGVVRYACDRPEGVGCTADTPEKAGQLMAAVDHGINAMRNGKVT